MTRLEQARAEIARRRALAGNATPGPWFATSDPLGDHVENGRARGRLAMDLGGDLAPAESRGRADAQHIAANDPVHVLAVLAAADATLDRHVADEATDVCDHCGRFREWPCPDAAAILDLYAPEEQWIPLSCREGRHRTTTTTGVCVCGAARADDGAR